MVDCGKIMADMLAAGLPVISISSPDGVAVLEAYSRALTTQERATADAIIANPMNQQRVPRPLYQIDADVNALTGTQMRNLWNDLAAGTPHKYLTSAGINAAAMYSMTWSAFNTTGAEATSAQRTIISCYIQDNPKYAVHPPFDSSINVPGDAPA